MMFGWKYPHACFRYFILDNQFTYKKKYHVYFVERVIAYIMLVLYKTQSCVVLSYLLLMIYKIVSELIVPMRTNGCTSVGCSS